MSVRVEISRVGITLPFIRRRTEATEFGNPRICLIYYFNEHATASRCFALGSICIRAAHLECLPEGSKVDVTVFGVLRVHPDVEPSLADARLGKVRGLPWTRADQRIRAVLRAHAKRPDQHA